MDRSITLQLLFVSIFATLTKSSSTHTYEQMNLCIQLCNPATTDFTFFAALYNPGLNQTFASCPIHVGQGQPTNENVCCATGPMNVTFPDQSHGTYTSFVFTFGQLPIPSNECIGTLNVLNAGDTKYTLDRFMHHNTNKCGLTHKQGSCTVVSPKHDFTTGEYAHIHVGSEYCTTGGATLDNPVSSYCHNLHVYDCSQAHC